LIDLEFELAALRQKYTDKHPQIIRRKEQIENLKKQLGGFSGQDLEYARLQRETEVNKKLYSTLKQQLEQARISEAEEVPDVSIVDPAALPSRPVNVQGAFGIILGLIMGLVVGGVLAFSMEMLDTSLGTIEEVEANTGLPVLGVIPSIERKDTKPETFLDKVIGSIFPQRREAEESYVRLLSHHRPTSPIAESFRNIRTNLKISAQRKTFLITSSNPEEGKTVIVINLGLVIAQENRRTLLVSSDLRRPAIAKSFGVEKEPGLSEILQGSASLDECTRNISDIILGDFDVEDTLTQSGLRNIWVLPAGSFPSNASELLSSRELSSLVAQLRDEFDCIIFDSPPILPVTDASLLAPLVDSVILCYEIGSTSRNALLRAKTQLEAVKANIGGIILNHTRPETEPLDPYPYYYRYKHRYYRHQEQESKKGL
jgi:tyrosine-protein kinase Etk/Wzc